MKALTLEQSNELIETLKSRFKNNMNRHNNIKWDNVSIKLYQNKGKLWSINEMERTGGEPDVVGYDETTNEYIFFDCSKETPLGRRNVCYDKKALESRTKFKPHNNALEMAKEMGIEILNEKDYIDLQRLEKFDLKTSSWIETEEELRNLGGALFGDNRYNRVFIYHNGAQSYYSVRGFRGKLRI